MDWAGRYINMAASVDRRQQMEDQLQQLGCGHRYSRFDAVDGRTVRNRIDRLTAGEFGCFMSHYHCIVEGADLEKHVHVMEDDVVLSPQTPYLLESVTDEVMEMCDILYTDIFVPMDVNVLLTLLQAYRATGLIEGRFADPGQRMPSCIMYTDLRTIGFAGATSYVVRAGSRNKVRRLLDQRISEGVDEPIDMVMRSLVNSGQLTAFCTIPFFTTIRPESIYATTMLDRGQDKLSEMAFYYLRKFFYVGKDEPDMKHATRELSATIPNSDYLDALVESIRFVLSERFIPF